MAHAAQPRRPHQPWHGARVCVCVWVCMRVYCKMHGTVTTVNSLASHGVMCECMWVCMRVCVACVVRHSSDSQASHGMVYVLPCHTLHSNSQISHGMGHITVCALNCVWLVCLLLGLRVRYCAQSIVHRTLKSCGSPCRRRRRCCCFCCCRSRCSASTCKSAYTGP